MKTKTLNWLRRLIVTAAAGSMTMVHAQSPQALAQNPPSGYATFTVNGMTTVGPTLATALRNEVTAAENVSVLALTNQGQGSIALIQAATTALASSYCREAGGALPGCDDIPGTLAPFLAEEALVFGLVPASQWDPRTFSINMPVYALAYVPAPQPTPVVPGGQPLVGMCYFFGTNGICNPGPGASVVNIKDGQVVIQDGKKYIARVTVGLLAMGSQGAQITFSPVLSG